MRARVGFAALAIAACTGATPGTTDAVTASTAADDDAASGTGLDDDDADSGGSTTDATGDPPGSTGGETTTGDPTTTGVAECSPAPPPDPAWLWAYQDELVAKLSGAVEISPGSSLGVRADPSERAAAADFLEGAFAEIGYTASRHDYGTGTNIYADLPATDPDAPILVVGAHYDTVPDSPGANDNATGIALVLALARYLREIPCRSRGVIFVLFDQEEIGLVGSDAFAGFLVDERLDVESVHTVDQMGWDADGDRAVELERADPGLLRFYEGAAGSLAPPVPLTPTRTGSTDHVSFRAYGLDAVGLTEEFVSGDTTPHYHLPSDTYATVDVDFLVSTTTLANLAFAAWIDASRAAVRPLRIDMPASGRPFY